jgi:hypothetical protein
MEDCGEKVFDGREHVRNPVPDGLRDSTGPGREELRENPFDEIRLGFSRTSHLGHHDLALSVSGFRNHLDDQRALLAFIGPNGFDEASRDDHHHGGLDVVQHDARTASRDIRLLFF